MGRLTLCVCGQVGYWKDLLEILVRVCVGAEQLQERKELQAQTRNFMKWVCTYSSSFNAVPGPCSMMACNVSNRLLRPWYIVCTALPKLLAATYSVQCQSA